MGIFAHIDIRTYVASRCRARHSVDKVLIFVYKQKSDYWMVLCGENMDNLSSSAVQTAQCKNPLSNALY